MTTKTVKEAGLSRRQKEAVYMAMFCATGHTSPVDGLDPAVAIAAVSKVLRQNRANGPTPQDRVDLRGALRAIRIIS